MRRAGVEPALPAAELGRRRRFAATWRPSSGRGAAVSLPPAEPGERRRPPGYSAWPPESSSPKLGAGCGGGPRIEGCRSCGVGLLALGEDREGAGA